jgi:uncharacterized protein YcfL
MKLEVGSWTLDVSSKLSSFNVLSTSNFQPPTSNLQQQKGRPVNRTAVVYDYDHYGLSHQTLEVSLSPPVSREIAAW